MKNSSDVYRKSPIRWIACLHQGKKRHTEELPASMENLNSARRRNRIRLQNSDTFIFPCGNLCLFPLPYSLPVLPPANFAVLISPVIVRPDGTVMCIASKPAGGVCFSREQLLCNQLVFVQLSFVKRGTRWPFCSTVSINMSYGRTHKPCSPYKA